MVVNSKKFSHVLSSCCRCGGCCAQILTLNNGEVCAVSQDEKRQTHVQSGERIPWHIGDCSYVLYFLKADREINDLKGCWAIYLLQRFFFPPKSTPENKSRWSIWQHRSWFLWKFSLKCRNDSFCWSLDWCLRKNGRHIKNKTFRISIAIGEIFDFPFLYKTGENVERKFVTHKMIKTVHCMVIIGKNRVNPLFHYYNEKSMMKKNVIIHSMGMGHFRWKVPCYSLWQKGREIYSLKELRG